MERPPGWYNLIEVLHMAKKVFLLSGMSGAGKSTVANIFEDFGFLVIEEIPVELVDQLVDLIITSTDRRYQKLVLTVSIGHFDKYYEALSSKIPNLQIILVEADDDIIMNRYKFTRRVHPLLADNTVNSIDQAIAIERNAMNAIDDMQITKISTSNISSSQLKKHVERLFFNSETKKLFSVTFTSFGFKNGPVKDADFVLDVRMLDNPFYIESLKKLTGLDEPVYRYVIEKENTQTYLVNVVRFLANVFEQYDKQGKRNLVVAVGCTGGQHRSVSVARYLHNFFSNNYTCFIRHRELEKE